MAWLSIYQTLPTHKKTMRLRRLLKIRKPEAVGYLVMLWLWALDGAPDGDLSEFTADDIAEICDWNKKPDVFLSALREAGWIDENNRLHDWDDYAGTLISSRERQRKQNRERQKRHRDKAKNSNADSETGNDDITRDVTRDTAVNNAPTVHYTTVDNSILTPPCTPPGGAAAGKGEIQSLCRAYEKAFGRLPRVAVEDMRGWLAEGMTGELISKIIGEAAAAEPHSPIQYIRSIVSRCKAGGITTVEQFEETNKRDAVPERGAGRAAQPDFTDTSRYEKVSW